MILKVEVAVAASLLALVGGAVDVRPAAFHEARFRARVVKGPTLEEHPQLSDLVPLAASHHNNTGVRFASLTWEFRESKDGARIPRPHMAASPTMLFHRDWREYRLLFWTPENATWFDVVAPKGRGVEVDGLVVKEIVPGPTLNANPDFSASDEYAPGWQLIGASKLKVDANGRTYVFAEEGNVASDLFAVKPGTKVEVTLRGCPPRYAVKNSRLSTAIYFYGSFAEAAKNDVRRAEMKVSIAGREREKSYEYAVPEGKRWARLVASGGSVYSCEAKEK